MKPVDASAMREIDLAAQEQYGIPELVLMESAGRETAQVALEKIKNSNESVAFFCGKGNNGGDGFVAARHLYLSGVPIAVFYIGEKKFLKGSARINFEILERFGCLIQEIRDGADLQQQLLQHGTFQLAVDALLGIGLKGEVQEPYRSVIHQINRLPCPVLAVDVPSGLCASTGRVLGCCVQAEWTVTFGLPKKGFYAEAGPSVSGEVIIKNIGYPKALLS
ncbi:MAG: NAD(P)H-hydrate epimerase [Candidatus Omnitrophota bacterium]